MYAKCMRLTSRSGCEHGATTAGCRRCRARVEEVLLLLLLLRLLLEAPLRIELLLWLLRLLAANAAASELRRLLLRLLVGLLRLLRLSPLSQALKIYPRNNHKRQKQIDYANAQSYVWISVHVRGSELAEAAAAAAAAAVRKTSQWSARGVAAVAVWARAGPSASRRAAPDWAARRRVVAAAALADRRSRVAAAGHTK